MDPELNGFPQGLGESYKVEFPGESPCKFYNSKNGYPISLLINSYYW